MEKSRSISKESYEIVEGEGSEYGLKEIWASGTILDGNSSGRFLEIILQEEVVMTDWGSCTKYME